MSFPILLIMHRFIFFLFLCFFLSAFPQGLSSVNLIDSAAHKQDEKLKTWDKELDNIQNILDQEENLVSRDSELRIMLADLRRSMLVEKESAESTRKEAYALLKTLGEEPKDNRFVADSPMVKEKREFYADHLAKMDLYIVQTKLLLARVDILTFSLAKLIRKQMIQSLVKTNPLPLSLYTMISASQEFHQQLKKIAQAPVSWYQRIDRQHWKDFFISPILWIYLIFTLFLGVLGFYLNNLRKRLILISGNANAFTRQWGVTLSLLTHVIFPSGVIAGAQWLIHQNFMLISGSFLLLLNHVCIFFLITLASFHLPRLFLLPLYGPQVCRRITLLGVMYAVNTFVFMFSKIFTPSEEMLAVGMLFVTSAEALLTLSALNPVWWRLQQGEFLFTSEIEKAEEEGGELQYVFYKKAVSKDSLWKILRLSICVVFLFSLVLQICGYGHIGSYITHNLAGTVLAIGMLSLAARFLHEWFIIGLTTSFVKKWLGLSDEGEGIFQFWINTFSSLIFLIISIFCIVLVWDLPILQTWLQFLNIFYGFHVGDVTISLRDILFSFLAFFASLLCFRLARRLLEEKIMPKVVLDTGVRYSFITMFGYIGLVISFLVAIRIVGVGLQNIIIIAGALSVGIGFGLRTVAENFISGLVLLFERPIKVGDLVDIGGVEGFVTRIHIRATQVMTFDRSEMVVPNAVLISTGITNWTHTNRQARIIIGIGVEYGSDIELVRETLLKVATNSVQILKRPNPDVLLMDFGEHCLKFELRCFTHDATVRLSVASQLRYEIDRVFKQAGIAIALPRRNIKILDNDDTL